jgi:hypothetical protein
MKCLNFKLRHYQYFEERHIFLLDTPRFGSGAWMVHSQVWTIKKKRVVTTDDCAGNAANNGTLSCFPSQKPYSALCRMRGAGQEKYGRVAHLNSFSYGGWQAFDLAWRVAQPLSCRHDL